MAMLRIFLIIIFLIAALAVTIIVLLQEGKSAGLGSIGGGSSNGGSSYWEKNKKYSLEGKFEKWTKITAAVFVLAAFLIMLIPNSSTSSKVAADQTNETSSQATPDASKAIGSIVNGDGETIATMEADAADEVAADDAEAADKAPESSAEASPAN